MASPPTERETRILESFFDLVGPQLHTAFPDRAAEFDNWRGKRDADPERWEKELPMMVVFMRCMIAAEKMTP